MVPPQNFISIPETDQQCVLSPAQSESTLLCMMLGLSHCIDLSIIYCESLVDGSGSSGRSSLEWRRQKYMPSVLVALTYLKMCLTAL